MAAYAGDQLINDSTKIYFSPTLASWFGSVRTATVSRTAV